MNYDKLTDEQLAEKAKNGDEKATDTLFIRYKGVVKSITRSYFLVGGDGEDVLQEGMIGLFSAVKNYNGLDAFLPYAKTCVKNAVFGAIKANSKKNFALNGYLSISEQDDENDKSSLLVDFNDSETALIDKEKYSKLQNVIKNALSKMEFTILQYYLKGYSYSEIGGFIKKDAKSIDNALQRIRKKLLAELNGKKGA